MDDSRVPPGGATPPGAGDTPEGPRPWPDADELQPGTLLVEWLARSPTSGGLVAEPTARVRIGRGPSCDIRLIRDQAAGTFTSRYHAEVSVQDDRVVVEDLKSSYGTTVNGTLLEHPVTIRDRDVIEIVGHFFGARLVKQAPSPFHEPVTLGDALAVLGRANASLPPTLAARAGIEACRAWPLDSPGLALVRDHLTITRTGALAAPELASTPRSGAIDDVGAVLALVEELSIRAGDIRHLDPRPTSLAELHERLLTWLHGEVAAGARRGDPPPWSAMDLVEELASLGVALPGFMNHPGITPRTDLASSQARGPRTPLFSLDALTPADDIVLDEDFDDLMSPPTGMPGPLPSAPLYPPPPPGLPSLGPAYSDFRAHRVGPLATSYFARHGAGRQEVFLKVLQPRHAADPAAVARFHNEPRMSRHLAERGVKVARVVDVAETDGRPFFAVERLHGHSLADAMRTQHSFNGRETFDVLRGCLQQAAAIHGAGVVHGDLSPENIFLRVAGPARVLRGIPPGSEPWLIDLECARTLASIEEEPASKVVGKAGYLAPEVALDGQLSVAADLYALGVVAYEMLTGRRPYPFTDLEQVRLAADTQMPAMPPLAMAPRLVEAFIAELIDPDPAERPASATEALARLDRLEDVHRWLSDPPPPQPPPFSPFDSPVLAGRAPAPPPPMARPPGPPGPPPPRRAPFSGPPPVPDGRLGFDPVVGSTLAPDLGAPPATPPPWMDDEDDAPEGVYRREEVTTAAFRLPRLDSLDDGEPPETVQFSVFVPSVIQRAASFLLDLAIYPPERRDEVLAARAGTSGTQGTPGLGDDAVVLDLELKLDGFRTEAPMATVAFVGEPVTHSMIVQAPDAAPGGLPHVYPGQVQVLHKGLLIARLVFQVRVHGDDEVVIGPAEGFDALDTPGAEQMRVRSAFASYSSRDRDEVIRRVQGINATGVDVFLDVLDLRAGELWEAELNRRISQADMLYLFWSPNAASSDWVEKEWRCALAHHGISRIHPVPLVDPTSAPPPRELAALHFNDIYLRYVAPREAGWLERVLGKLKG